MNAEMLTRGLRPAEPSELLVGAKLPGHIYNERGRVLARGGQELTQDHIELLRGEKLMVGPEWGDPPKPDRPAESAQSAHAESPDEVLDGLFDRTFGNGPVSNERRCRRHRYEAPLEIEIHEAEGHLASVRKVKVMSSDISSNGFSFIHNQYVPTGAVVKVRFDSVPRRPELTGVVRNCVQIRGMNHRVGVEFAQRD